MFLSNFGIDYDAIAKEQFVNLIEVLNLSKHKKTPLSSGARQVSNRPAEKENANKRKTRHTQPLKLNMACFFIDQSMLISRCCANTA
ncbi:MAG: hypothetical protein PUD76_04350 [Clostridia bacterium]|nr:hypothetical protein [Clostridia bacterium]